MIFPAIAMNIACDYFKENLMAVSKSSNFLWICFYRILLLYYGALRLVHCITLQRASDFCSSEKVAAILILSNTLAV